MTDRERLIQLISEIKTYEYGGLAKVCNEAIADYLLKNGVIVPPVKVGDTVYINGKPAEVSFIHIEHDMTFCIQIDCFWKDCEDCCFVDSNTCNNGYFEFTASDIGKTVFLTRESAEKVLAERSSEQ